jgi:hypothetical protein
MILLPSLLRKANGVEALSYQVAPGLSMATAEGILAADVAARVGYLVDGDKGGRALRKLLIDAGVPTQKIHALPPDMGVEDLVDEAVLIEAIVGLLGDSGYTGAMPTPAVLLGPGSAMSKVKAWCDSNGVSPPSKTAIASRVVTDQDSLALSAGAEATLIKLHTWIESTLAG